MLTIAPLPCLAMCGSTCLQVRNMLFKLTSLTRSQLSSVVSNRTADVDDPDIGVQHIDPAECGDAGVDHGGDVFGNRYVSGDRLANAARPLDDPLGLDGRIEVDVGGQYPRPLTGEEHRRRLAVAPAGATRACSRNQRHFPLESITQRFLPTGILMTTGRPSRARPFEATLDQVDDAGSQPCDTIRL